MVSFFFPPPEPFVDLVGSMYYFMHFHKNSNNTMAALCRDALQFFFFFKRSWGRVLFLGEQSLQCSHDIPAKTANVVNEPHWRPPRLNTHTWVRVLLCVVRSRVLVKSSRGFLPAFSRCCDWCCFLGLLHVFDSDTAWHSCHTSVVQWFIMCFAQFFFFFYLVSVSCVYTVCSQLLSNSHGEYDQSSFPVQCVEDWFSAEILDFFFANLNQMDLNVFLKLLHFSPRQNRPVRLVFLQFTCVPLLACCYGAVEAEYCKTQTFIFAMCFFNLQQICSSWCFSFFFLQDIFLTLLTDQPAKNTRLQRPRPERTPHLLDNLNPVMILETTNISIYIGPLKINLCVVEFNSLPRWRLIQSIFTRTLRSSASLWIC